MESKFCVIFAVVCLNWFCLVSSVGGSGCSTPKLSRHSRVVDIEKPLDSYETFPDGSVVRLSCDPGYTLFGSTNITCSDGEWLQSGPKCFLEVAAGNPCQMSSQPDEFASAHLSTDGDPHTCVAFGTNETKLVWSVDTFQAHSVRVVSVLSEFFLPNSTLEIRVGSHQPSTGAKFNKLCTRQILTESQQHEQRFRCDEGAVVGRYVSITIVEPGDHHVSLCEVHVYSDSGLSAFDSCPEKPALRGAARYVFENQCVQFIGQRSLAEGEALCRQEGGTIVRPASRAFQSFLDFNVMQYVEKTLDQLLPSFWIDAKRSGGSGGGGGDGWSFGDGTPIRQVLIVDGAGDSDGAQDCLVSDIRKWHSESCGNQHQVICVSAPASCGTPGVPESSSWSSSWNRTKIAVNHSVTFSCEPGFIGHTADVRCFANGSLSAEVSCTPTDDSFVASSLLPELKAYLRSFAMFAKLSAEALTALLVVLGALIATLMSATVLCCCVVLKRQRDRKISDRTHWSLMSFSVPMRDLPVTNSSRLFRTPINDEKFLTVPKS